MPRQDLRKGVADIRATFNAPDAEDAKRLLKRFITKYQASALKQATWTAEALPQGFTIFALRRPIGATAE